VIALRQAHEDLAADPGASTTFNARVLSRAGDPAILWTTVALTSAVLKLAAATWSMALASRVLFPTVLLACASWSADAVAAARSVGAADAPALAATCSTTRALSSGVSPISAPPGSLIVLSRVYSAPASARTAPVANSARSTPSDGVLLLVVFETEPGVVVVAVVLVLPAVVLVAVVDEETV